MSPFVWFASPRHSKLIPGSNSSTDAADAAITIYLLSTGDLDARTTKCDVAPTLVREAHYLLHVGSGAKMNDWPLWRRRRACQTHHQGEPTISTPETTCVPRLLATNYSTYFKPSQVDVLWPIREITARGGEIDQGRGELPSHTRALACLVNKYIPRIQV